MRIIAPFCAILVFAGLSTVEAATIPHGLVGYYRFNGNASDDSGAGNDGAIVGVVESVADRFGNPNGAFHFSQGINRVLLSNVAIDQSPGGANTVSFWMKWDGIFYHPNDVGALPFVWGGWDGSTDDAHGALYLTGSQSWYPSDVKVRFGLNGLAGHGETFGVSNPQGIDEWTHVVAVFANSGDIRDGKLYLNGRLAPSELFSAAPGTFVTSWAGPNPAIGGLNVETSAYQFIGAIDDVRIYNRGLSGGEVRALFAIESRHAR